MPTIPSERSSLFTLPSSHIRKAKVQSTEYITQIRDLCFSFYTPGYGGRDTAKERQGQMVDIAKQQAFRPGLRRNRP